MNETTKAKPTTEAAGQFDALVMPDMASDYEIGGGWGCCISWTNPDEEFGAWDGSEDTIFSVHGHQPIIPKVGQTLLAEFQTTFKKFEFISIERCGDPRDMFFAKVKPIAELMK